ncbi:MAG: hypothetical protein ACK53W_12495 [Gemmatimonadota bacterium]
MNIEIKKVATGEFDVLVDGAPTRYRIINGSAGLSGRDTQNVYGITNSATGAVRWIGSLASAKKVVRGWVAIRARAGEAA